MLGPSSWLQPAYYVGRPGYADTHAQAVADYYDTESKQVLLDSGLQTAGILVGRDGKIDRILTGELLNSCDDLEVVDVDDLVIMAGVVDSHVHVNEPGRTDWEGYWSATRAAAAGGVTTIVDMPLNSIPSTTTVSNLKTKLKAAQGQTHVDVAFWGGVIPGNQDELRGLVDAGVVGFKCFLCPSGVDEFPHVSISDVEMALHKLQGTSSLLAVVARTGSTDKLNVVAISREVGGIESRSTVSLVVTRLAFTQVQKGEVATSFKVTIYACLYLSCQNTKLVPDGRGKNERVWISSTAIKTKEKESEQRKKKFTGLTRVWETCDSAQQWRKSSLLSGQSILTVCHCGGMVQLGQDQVYSLCAIVEEVFTLEKISGWHGSRERYRQAISFGLTPNRIMSRQPAVHSLTINTRYLEGNKYPYSPIFIRSVLKRTCALLMAPRLNFLLVLPVESAGDWLSLGESIAIEVPGFTSQAVVAVRCFCNLAQCVMTSYMCKSQGGGCFSDLTGYLDVYKARHGCVEMLERERQQQCHSPRPPLLCCYKDMCNHVDSPEARLRFNETFIGLLNTSEGTRLYNSQQSNANNEIWFKAATIAVPICGALILVVLIALAIKILRKEQDRFEPSLGRKPLQHFEHNVNTFSKKVPLLMRHHNEGVPPNMVFHPQDCPSSSIRFEKNETNAKLNVTTVKPNCVQPNDYTLLVPSTQLNLQKTNNINNNLYRNVNLAFTVPATHPLPPVNSKLYDKQRLAEVSSWGDASASASHV
uniref:Allantoinase n=1 Tax=Timema cristinae TaxID=61476 RepID=A0A7R9D079_TIMCR|nr:unnamed protein product [Timema cristinae]